jgi:hypothetical protein
VQRNGKNYYVYADPAHYQVYVGTPSQYQKYQQLRLASNLAQDQLETAQLNSWGPGNSWKQLKQFARLVGGFSRSLNPGLIRQLTLAK